MEDDSKNSNTEEEIKKALLKRALGYEYDEVQEEYSRDENGECVLVKKKVSKKTVPPDITSAKFLLDFFNGDNLNFSKLSDEELLIERDRLISLLEKGESENEDGTML